MTPTTQIQSKARRLLDQGRVDPLPARAYTVQGDHGVYIVIWVSGSATCNCPATTQCSHIEATRLYEQQEGTD